MHPYLALSVAAAVAATITAVARWRRRTDDAWVWQYWHYAADAEPTIAITPGALRDYCTLRGEAEGVPPRIVAGWLLQDAARWEDFLAWVRTGPAEIKAPVPEAAAPAVVAITPHAATQLA